MTSNESRHSVDEKLKMKGEISEEACKLRRKACDGACTYENLYLKGQLQILKEVFNTSQERNQNSERELRANLRKVSDELKKEKEVRNIEIFHLQEELKSTKKELQKVKLTEIDFKKLTVHHGILTKQNEHLLITVEESESEINNVKKELEALEECMKKEREEYENLLVEINAVLVSERQLKNHVEHENNHLKADLHYIKTMLTHKDILVLRSNPGNVTHATTNDNNTTQQSKVNNRCQRKKRKKSHKKSSRLKNCENQKNVINTDAVAS